MGHRDSASALLTAAPEKVFGLITDPSRLTTWNHAITEIIEVPDHLEPGSVWKVRIHAMGRSWVSRSQVAAIDPAAGHFAYRSQSDDGNPSYADWRWEVEPHGESSKVTVEVDLNPTSFWRKYLLVHIRRPALRKEIRDSLKAIGEVVGR